MFKITNEMIQGNSFPVTFQKGQEYYRQKKIKSVRFFQEQMLFEAVVSGMQNYNIRINFREDGTLSYTRCSCPSSQGYWGFCKHIIAVLLLIRDKDEQGFFNDLKSRQAAKQILNFFQNRPNILKTPLNLEITYELNGGDSYGIGAYSSLSLRVGEERLYVVRDIRKFLEKVKKNEEMEFGKNFSYDPSRHIFRPDDRAVMNFLLEFYETEELSDKFGQGSGKVGIFRDKQILLAPAAVKRLFEILKGRIFKANIQGRLYEEMRVLEEDFPVNFTVTKAGRGLELGINIDDTLIPLTDDGEYFFTGGSIYKISKKQQESFKPFYIALVSQKSRKIRFPEEDCEQFVSEVLPFAESAGEVTIDEEVESMIEKVDLETEIYLDRDSDTITARVIFKYGERRINPFAPMDKQTGPGGKILLRNMEKERIILDILEDSEFKVRNSELYLSDEATIFDFVYNVVPKLQQHARIYYSENFKNINIRSSVSFQGGMRLNAGSGMLEFSFSVDGIDRSELADIFQSLKRKKKYYRLKDGSFLLLENKELAKMADAVEYLGFGREDFDKDFIEIPRYRALYLDQYIKNAGFYNFERNRAFEEFVQNILQPQNLDLTIPAGFEGILREYQKLGFKWLKTLACYGLGGILADDMGLGKTLQVITLIASAKAEKGTCPSLVVAPTSLLYNWYAEVEKFAPDLNTVIISGGREERLKQMENIRGADMVITSYPLIRRDIEDYADYTFRYCILDEAQHIKNPNSQNARSVKMINAENRFALTGTPIENSLTELWSIFDFILPGYLFSHSKFMQKYERPIIRDNNRMALEDLGMHIRPFILRRMKMDVLGELPEKIEHKMVAELTDEQKKLYLAYLQQIKGEIEREIEEKGFERSHIKILSGLTRLRQICCHPSIFLDGFEGSSGKMLLLQEVVKDSIESGHRILLFSQFTSMLHIIRDWLKAEKIGYLYLDGNTETEERGKLVDAFNGGKGKVFLISLKAGGTGLNLTGADTVIHYDPWWNPAVEEQATDRAYRIGQDKAVHVIKLVTKGTIEEKIFELQEKKRRLIDTVIQPGETLLSKMSEEEVRALFEQ